MTPKKFRLPEGATPINEMMERYPDWVWLPCPVCDELAHFMEDRYGMHAWCFESPTGKRMIPKLRRIEKGTTKMSLFEE